MLALAVGVGRALAVAVGVRLALAAGVELAAGVSVSVCDRVGSGNSHSIDMAPPSSAEPRS
jgi:hypothetical protein